jgi:hypothetical protein
MAELGRGSEDNSVMPVHNTPTMKIASDNGMHLDDNRPTHSDVQLEAKAGGMNILLGFRYLGQS